MLIPGSVREFDESWPCRPLVSDIFCEEGRVPFPRLRSAMNEGVCARLEWMCELTEVRRWGGKKSYFLGVALWLNAVVQKKSSPSCLLPPFASIHSPLSHTKTTPLCSHGDNHHQQGQTPYFKQDYISRNSYRTNTAFKTDDKSQVAFIPGRTKRTRQLKERTSAHLKERLTTVFTPRNAIHTLRVH